MANQVSFDSLPERLAKQWLESNCYILDTETTGLGEDAEICELSIIDASGSVLLDTLVQPVMQIPAEVTQIHGITNDMVATAPTWRDIERDVLNLLLSAPALVIYNAPFDMRLLRQTAAINFSSSTTLDILNFIESRAQSAMLSYAEYYGDWDELRQSYCWQRLINAVRQQNVQIQGQVHRAQADCRMTLGVIEAMARNAS